jgi:hypothetical protein
MDSLRDQGFAVIEDIFTHGEVDAITADIRAADAKGPGFRVTRDLFAIRRFLQEIPSIQPLIFTDRLQTLLTELAGPGYFGVKSIYFDKPGSSNWFVAWHQDLTISVDKKVAVAGFGPIGKASLQDCLSLLEKYDPGFKGSTYQHGTT